MEALKCEMVVMLVLHQIVIFIRRYANKLINIPFPTLISGEGEISKTASTLQSHSNIKPLIVSDKTLTELGITKQLVEVLEKASIAYELYDDVLPDPTLSIIDKGVERYNFQRCDSIIALGGGSVMDCAKGIAACVVKNKDIKSLTGLFKVRKRLPTFIAIPTTAGTGSEATLVAVISDPAKKQKFTVIDPCLVPKYAIIDPLLMVGLPQHITAQTGLDALTHAIESYIGLHATGQTKAYSLDAIKRIFEHLPTAYTDGKNLKARNEMAIASYHAGIAFTRTSIGYVHAIAHQLGGFYHIPHGLANAVLLPYVLDFSFDKAMESYAELAYETHIANPKDSSHKAANKFVEQVKLLINTVNIQSAFMELKIEDINVLARRAIKEAYCDYPVPKLMSVKQCEAILNGLLVNET